LKIDYYVFVSTKSHFFQSSSVKFRIENRFQFNFRLCNNCEFVECNQSRKRFHLLNLKNFDKLKHETNDSIERVLFEIAKFKTICHFLKPFEILRLPIFVFFLFILFLNETIF